MQCTIDGEGSSGPCIVMWVRRLEVSASILITGHQRSIFFKNTDNRERLKHKTLIWNACLSNAIIKSHWCSGTVGTWKLVLCSSTDLNYSCGFMWKSRKAKNSFFFFFCYPKMTKVVFSRSQLIFLCRNALLVMNTTHPGSILIGSWWRSGGVTALQPWS